ATIAGAGWLAVAPCETSDVLFADFDAVRVRGAMLYRRRDPRAEAAARPPCTVPLAPARRSSVSGRTLPASRSGTVARRAAGPKPRPLMGPRAPVQGHAASLLESARLLADQGRVREALACCDRLLADDRLDADAHYFRGAILA